MVAFALQCKYLSLVSGRRMGTFHKANGCSRMSRRLACAFGQKGMPPFDFNKLHTQYLRIINISSEAQRIHVINPTTAECTGATTIMKGKPSQVFVVKFAAKAVEKWPNQSTAPRPRLLRTEFTIPNW